MKKILFLFLVSFLIQSCDDGDIIVTSFNFDDVELQNCGNLGNFVFFKVNPDALESLSLRLGITDSLYKSAGVKTYEINGTTNFVNYRTYDGDLGANYFCSSIPPTSPRVTIDYFAASGTVEVTTTFVYDDEDGVPTEMEFDGDTDGDGIPDIYDFDDDGDNVPTILELNREDTDTDPFTNPLNTDEASGDILQDFLDADDDGDGIATRDEDKNMNQDPTDDITEASVGPDYLNAAVSKSNKATKYRQHTYKIFKTVKIVLKDLVLQNGDEELIIETLNMGTIENIETMEKKITPGF